VRVSGSNEGFVLAMKCFLTVSCSFAKRKHFSGEQPTSKRIILLCCLRRTVVPVMQATKSSARENTTPNC